MYPTSLLPSSNSPCPAISPTNRTIFRQRPNCQTSTGRSFNGSFPVSGIVVVKCSSEENGAAPKMKDILAGLVDERVGELMSREENRGLLDGLEKATYRVEMARKKLLEIERQEKEAQMTRDYVRKLENREAEIAECERELSEARAMVEDAECSLSANMGQMWSGGALENFEGQEIDKDVERFESVKAAAVAAFVGTLAGIPVSISEASNGVQLIFNLAVIFISCALFGVTFRYTIRRDLENIQLKTGTSAAFGVVKGLAELVAGPPSELNSGSLLSHAANGAMYISQNLLIFIFASVGLDYCFKVGLLNPFPIGKSVSQNKAK